MSLALERVRAVGREVLAEWRIDTVSDVSRDGGSGRLELLIVLSRRGDERRALLNLPRVDTPEFDEALRRALAWAVPPGAIR
jgi:hypothetical protein